MKSARWKSPGFTRVGGERPPTWWSNTTFVGLETNKGLYDWWFREALEGFAMSCFCSIVKPAKSLFVTIARVKQAILLLSFLDDSF